MADGFVVTKNDRLVAMLGVELQATANGLDINDKNIRSFIDNQIEVIAHWSAQCRWQQSLLHNVCRDDS
jgi:hypothetical protein